MAIQTIIGLKRLEFAKERLEPDLSAPQRRRLMVGMLEAVVAATLAADLGPVALATSEPSAPLLARTLGVVILSDGDLPWNDGLVHALALAVPRPRRVLYLAGDIPLLTPGELREFADAAPAGGVAIARARDAGTNALLITPPDALRPSFGSHRSSEVHAALARAANLPYRVIDIPGLALDVDTIADARDAGVLTDAVSETGRDPRDG